MSAEWVDHAAEARDHLARADKQNPADVAGDNLRMEALVHATLALVEQQRIANQLAVAEIDSRMRDAEHPFPIRTYLTRDQWSSLDVDEADTESYL